MTIEEKAELALAEIKECNSGFGLDCTDVTHIGRWRGMDIFQDTTKPKPGQPLCVGAACAALVRDDGFVRTAGAYDIRHSDFPELIDED